MIVEDIKSYFEKLQGTLCAVAEKMPDNLLSSCRIIVEALRLGNKVLIMGNGGSAADAQHFAAELVGRFLMERKALPAIALTTDTSILTAVGNDYGFDEIFKRQIEALARPGDVVIGLSTSGMSNNVYHAMIAANQIGCKTIGLLGHDGGTIAGLVDVDLTVPEVHTPFIQTAHGAILHLLCDLLEKELFAQPTFT